MGEHCEALLRAWLNGGKALDDEQVKAALDSDAAAPARRPGRPRADRGRTAHAAVKLWFEVTEARVVLSHRSDHPRLFEALRAASPDELRLLADASLRALRPGEKALAIVAARHGTTSGALKKKLQRGLSIFQEVRDALPKALTIRYEHLCNSTLEAELGLSAPLPAGPTLGARPLRGGH